MQERYSGSASFCAGCGEVLDPAQKLLAPMPQRGAEHSSSGQKARSQFAGDKP